MESNEIYKQKMVARLKRHCAEINALDVKAENAAIDTKLRYVEELDVLHTKKREAIKKICELENASGEIWGKVQLTVDEVSNDLGTGIAHAATMFK